MRRTILFMFGILFVLGFFVVGCTRPEPIYQCPEDETCECEAETITQYVCQNNDIVDDAAECEPYECQTECEECPPCEPETAIKYVCEDGRTVDSSEECDEPQGEDVGFVPVTTNEEGTFIENVSVNPACFKGMNGGGVYFKIGTVPKNVTFEVKERPEEEFKEAYKTSGKFSGTRYFVICAEDVCPASYSLGDFDLVKGKQYLLRLKFDFIGRSAQYSNEHVIDAREGSAYTTKKC